MAREDAQLKLRLADELKAKVVDAAKAHGRSVNAEIVSAIESALEGGSVNTSDLQRILEEERAVSSKTMMMLEAQFDLLTDYRGVMKSANDQTLQQANIIKSLCSIIESLEPGPDVLNLVNRLSEASISMLKRAEASNRRTPDGDTLEDIEATMAEAQALIKKAKE